MCDPRLNQYMEVFLEISALLCISQFQLRPAPTPPFPPPPVFFIFAYFVYFHTVSYKFKVQRTPTELGLPVVLLSRYEQNLYLVRTPVRK